MRVADRKSATAGSVPDGGKAAAGRRVLMAASVASMIDQFNMPNIRLLQDMGYEVHVVCNFRKGNTCDASRIWKLKRELEDLGVCWHQWDCPRSVYCLAKCGKAFVQLWRLTGQYHFEFVHCHSPAGGALARIVAHFRNIPVVYTAHGFHFFKGAPVKNWFLYYPAEKLLAYWTDALVTVNQEDYAFARRNLAAKRIYRIPGIGVDIGKFAGQSELEPAAEQKPEAGWTPPQGRFIILHVAELIKRKNHRTMLQALGLIEEQNRKYGNRYSFLYLICGIGPERDRLMRCAAGLGLTGRVRFLGYRQDIRRLLRTADVFVLPSVQEGLPAAVVEAMASGLPVVASGIRGNAELVDAHGGFLVNAKDAGGYAKALIRLMEYKRDAPEKFRRMGAYNRKKSMAYDTVRVENCMRNIYADFSPEFCGSSYPLER